MKRQGMLMCLGAIMGVLPSCAAQGPIWSYEGATGPAAWGQLDPSYGACATGRSQSPINIEEVLPRDLPNIGFRYGSTNVRLHNTGRAIEQLVEPGNTLVLGTMPYTLQSLRFRAPSEHRAAGHTFAMELQWLHKSAQGHLAQVAVMVKPGRENAALAVLLQQMPTAVGETVQAPQAIALNQLLPKQRTYMRYSGSQTEPPCWENVIWFVLTEPIEASVTQIAAFTRLHRNNARPTSPVGKRTVFLDATP